MPEMRNGVPHFRRSQVRVGEHILVWGKAGMPPDLEGEVVAIARNEDGDLCVSVGEVRPERLSTGIHEGVARSPEGQAGGGR